VRDGRVTIIDVGHKAGVSKSTVSLVLAGSPLVAETTRARVSKAMSELGYVYNRGAATLRGGKADVLGMVINDLSNPFFVELAIGIEQTCQNGAFVPFLANCSESPSRQLQVIRSMLEHGAAGLVISPSIGSTVAELKPLIADIPTVQVMRRLPGLRASLVSPENREGARKATQRLAKLGHSRIAFVGGTASMIVRNERVAGYLQALEESGLPVDPTLIVEAPITYSGGRQVTQRLVRAADGATAALCFNDVVAIGLMNALVEAGLKPGADFAVIGFDDIIEAQHTTPGLTSVAAHGRDVGARAAQMLMQQIASGDWTAQTVLLPTTLVVRESCGGKSIESEESET